MIQVCLNPQRGGVRSGLSRANREQMKDFAAVVWANAADGWRKEPWPRANDCWPEFVKVGWIAEVTDDDFV